MHLLVGLGNPGAAYSRNRHNIGFMAADEIVRRHGFSGWRNKFQGELAEGQIAGEKVLVLKPHTFMNLSGQAVAAATHFHKIPTDHVTVFYDELDLAQGRVRVKKGGGSGGHNGIRSIDQHLGPDYWRVRLGIGHPGDKRLVMPWVLGDFTRAEQDWLAPLLDAATRHLPLLLSGRQNDFMSKIAQEMPKPPAEGEG